MSSDGDPIGLGVTEAVAQRRLGLSRGEFLRRASALAAVPLLGAGSLEGLAEAAPSATTLRMINYINWIGKTEFADFKRKTGIAVRQIVVNDGPERVTKIATDPDSVDFVLCDLTSAGPLDDHGLLAKLDWTKIPNYKLVPAHYKQYQFGQKKALGMVSDFGRTSFVYRTDIVKEKLRSWHDVWRVAPKYSGQIVLIDAVNDALSAALTVSGHNINTRVSSEIKRGRDALIKIKPHLHSLTSTNALQPLLDGSAAIAMDWDFDAAAVLPKHKDVPLRWVDAEDTMYAYLEGWCAVKESKVLPQVMQFMNNHLDPRVYAKFVNTLSITCMLPAALKYVNPSVLKSPVLNVTPKARENIVFGTSHGEAQKLYDRAWAEFKSA
jgi:spermidine/putrescine transport system substrate-binding protein